jgi:hypothetical protein
LKVYRDLEVPPEKREKWTVPRGYVVSENDPRYPEGVWGAKLGRVVSKIRNDGTYADLRRELKRMGLNYEVLKSRKAEVDVLRSRKFDDNILLAALKVYRDLELPPEKHDKWTVPRSYVVPEEVASYPESTWGMKLGRIVNGIRLEGNYANLRGDLESMGLDYEVKKREMKGKDGDKAQ